MIACNGWHSLRAEHSSEGDSGIRIGGGGGHGLRRLSLSHPPLEERIEALRNLALRNLPAG